VAVRLSVSKPDVDNMWKLYLDMHRVEVHPKTLIPDRLLGSNMDEGSVKLLFWLIRSQAHLSRTPTWEVWSDPAFTRVHAHVTRLYPLPQVIAKLLTQMLPDMKASLGKLSTEYRNLLAWCLDVHMSRTAWLPVP
jgi:hypothetical protein